MSELWTGLAARPPVAAAGGPVLSVVVPIYNEADSLGLLIDAIAQALKDQITYEIICVDDGSYDGSADLLRLLAQSRSDLKVILLRRNYGQTPALAAGFDHAQGSIVVSMDGDLQNDPADIPRLIAKLEEGFDLVSGWRRQRQDPWLSRILPSRIANGLIAAVTGVKLHDYGCALKAYRAELLRDMHLYGELHRFLPALASIEGARIAELPVAHQRRRFGRSKYGLSRTLRVTIDLLTVYFMRKFMTQPMHMFGSLGLLSMLAGVGISLYLMVVKFLGNQDIGDRPLLYLAIVLFLSGIQLFSLGLLAELVMRTYYESQRRPIYRVREVIGPPPE